LKEQNSNIIYERNFEVMLQELGLSRRKLEVELSENNALVKILRNELQRMIDILEKREVEAPEFHADVTDLKKKLTEKMENGNEDLVNLSRGYDIIL
jgi:hypothetical protein